MGYGLLTLGRDVSIQLAYEEYIVVTSMVVAGVHIVDHYYFCFEANKEQGTGANVLEAGPILLLEKFDVLKIDFYLIYK